MEPRWKRGVFPASTDGLAIGGLDPVAYFKDGRATAGSGDLEVSWSGVNWRFASAANREAFLADPDRFAPRLGGLCAFAVSLSDRPGVPPAPAGSPQWWTLHNGRLYLNKNWLAHTLFRLLGRAARADAVWSKLAA